MGQFPWQSTLQTSNIRQTKPVLKFQFEFRLDIKVFFITIGL